MNLIELKAAAYDALVRLEQAQKELQEINQAIAKELQKDAE